eukprot:2400027-Amphidinium_carterae.1
MSCTQEVDTRAIDGDTTGLKAVQTVFFSFYVVELLSRIWVYRWPLMISQTSCHQGPRPNPC